MASRAGDVFGDAVYVDDDDYITVIKNGDTIQLYRLRPGERFVRLEPRSETPITYRIIIKDADDRGFEAWCDIDPP